MMQHSPFRFGLIGFGAWGRFHAQAIAKTAGAELTAIAARSKSSCDAARDAYPDVQVADYHGLLARDDIDLVHIVVPSHLHHEIASAVLGAGKHVLLEKPMALLLDECDSLIELARQKERLLAIGHELRLSSLWCKVHELVNAGFLGQPQ